MKQFFTLLSFSGLMSFAILTHAEDASALSFRNIDDTTANSASILSSAENDGDLNDQDTDLIADPLLQASLENGPSDTDQANSDNADSDDNADDSADDSSDDSADDSSDDSSDEDEADDTTDSNNSQTNG
jgi:hypothetical protein